MFELLLGIREKTNEQYSRKPLKTKKKKQKKKYLLFLLAPLRQHVSPFFPHEVDVPRSLVWWFYDEKPLLFYLRTMRRRVENITGI